jgi:enhancing lycopene biosynthesis protein 2
LASNRAEHHAGNHVTGKEMPESRNVCVDVARISRVAILDTKQADVSKCDALIILVEFGDAKNLNRWALPGQVGQIYLEVKTMILYFINAQKSLSY